MYSSRMVLVVFHPLIALSIKLTLVLELQLQINLLIGRIQEETKELQGQVEELIVGHGALKACNLYCFMKTIFYI